VLVSCFINFRQHLFIISGADANCVHGCVTLVTSKVGFSPGNQKLVNF